MRPIGLTLLSCLVLLLALKLPADAKRSGYYDFSSTPSPVRVREYYRQDGTYVAPHYRTSPNNTRWDNWSTTGNYNPYTGRPGTRQYSY